MISIQSIQQMMQHIREDSKKELEPIVEIFPELQKEILKHLLWGAFFEKNLFKTKEELAFPFSFLEQIKEQLKEEAPSFKHHFFVPQVEKQVEGKYIQVVCESEEDFEYKVIVSQDNGSFKPLSDVKVIVALTLPDASIVFQSLKKGSELDPYDTWLHSYIDMYEEWRHKVMHKLYAYYIQVGGHGRWIQDSYNDSYVAQINAELGDAGSIFVYVEDDKFEAQVDMY